MPYCASTLIIFAFVRDLLWKAEGSRQLVQFGKRVTKVTKFFRKKLLEVIKEKWKLWEDNRKSLEKEISRFSCISYRLPLTFLQVDTWLESSLRMREIAACAIHRPDCFGYLSKQQEHARKTSSPTGWSRRYCVLKDAALYFYDDANAEKAFGVACLHGFRVHSSAPTSGGRKHAFELQPPDPTQRSYIFATESEMDKKR